MSDATKERQPLLAARSGTAAQTNTASPPRSSSSSSSAASVSYGSRDAVSSQHPSPEQVRQAANAGALRQTLPSHVRAALLKRAREAKRSRGGGSGGNGSSTTITGNSSIARMGTSSDSDAGSTDEEAELAEIIARTPDIEAIFQRRGSDAGDQQQQQQQQQRDSNFGVNSNLANSYGTIRHDGSDTSRIPVKACEMEADVDEADRSNNNSNGSGSNNNNNSNNGNGNISNMQRQRSSSVIRVGASTPLSRATQKAKKRRGSVSGDLSPSFRKPLGGTAEEDEDAFFSEEHAALLEEFTNPVGRYRRVWLLLIFLFVMYNAVIIPFSLAFQSLWTDLRFFVTIAIFNYVGDLFFCLDVTLYFWTPYTRDGMYERNLPDIRKHYLKTWFAIDLISSLPLDLLLFPWGIEAVLLARFTRFLRFGKYDQYFTVWEQYSTRAPEAVRFFKLMFGLMLILHWLACFWFWTGYLYGFGATTWLPPHEFKRADVATQYVASLWWSTNIITQVGGDPGLPTNNFERMSDFFVSFIAVFVVAVVIGNVTELVSELSADEGERRAKLAVLNSFMFARRLPDDLQKRIRNYHFALWSRRGVVDNGNNSILEELPSSLRTEVSLIMNQDILGKVPIFQASSPGFINSLVLHLKPQTYTPKEFIVREGDMGSEMFFISRGQVHVMAGGKIVGRIGEGGFFGEIAVLQENAQRTASIRAVNFCDVFVLTHEDLQHLFKTFPAEKAVIMHVAETRRAKDLLRKVLQDPQLLAREHTEGFRDPTLVNLLIDLFQPLDLAHMQTNMNRAAAGSNSAASTTLTVSGLRIDEHGEILLGDEDDATMSEEDIARAGLLFSPEDRAETIYFIGKGCVDIFAHKELEEHTEKAQRRSIERKASIASARSSPVKAARKQQKQQQQQQQQQQRKHSVDSDADTETDDSKDDADDDDDHARAHTQLDEEDEDTASGTDSEESDRPQHVIRLTEGHFFGGIMGNGDHYRVSAVLPEEFRDDAIIFALTSHELVALHAYYDSLPPPAEEDDDEQQCKAEREKKHQQHQHQHHHHHKHRQQQQKKGNGGKAAAAAAPPSYQQEDDGEDCSSSGSSSSSSDEDGSTYGARRKRHLCQRHSMKKSLVTWLQRHRTPLDYVKSMVSLHVHTQQIQKLAAEEQKSLSWKMLLKIIMHKSKAHAAKAAATAVATAASAAATISHHHQQHQQTTSITVSSPSAAVDDAENGARRSPAFRRREAQRLAAEGGSSAAASSASEEQQLPHFAVPQLPVIKVVSSDKDATAVATAIPHQADRLALLAAGVTPSASASASSSPEDPRSGEPPGFEPLQEQGEEGEEVAAERLRRSIQEATNTATRAVAAGTATGADKETQQGKAASSLTLSPPTINSGRGSLSGAAVPGLQSAAAAASAVSASAGESPVSRPRRVGTTILISPAPSPPIIVEPYRAAGSDGSHGAEQQHPPVQGSSVWEQHPGAIVSQLSLDTHTPQQTPLPPAAAVAAAYPSASEHKQPPPHPSSTASPNPAGPANYLRSPPSTLRPDLMRSVSVGSPRGQNSNVLLGAPPVGTPASPFSPLLNRPQQNTRSVSSSQSVSELLAAADMAASNQRMAADAAAAHPQRGFGRRSVSMIGGDSDVSIEHDEPLSGGRGSSSSRLRQQSHGPAQHRRGNSTSQQQQPASAGGGLSSSEHALDWLTGGTRARASSAAADEAKEPKSHSAHELGQQQQQQQPAGGSSGQLLTSPLRKPDLRRLPSTPAQLPRSPAALSIVRAPSAAVSSSSSSSYAAAAAGPAAGQTNLLSARGRGISIPNHGPGSTVSGHSSSSSSSAQPFSFLLSLPTGGGGAHPSPPSLISPLASPASSTRSSNEQFGSPPGGAASAAAAAGGVGAGAKRHSGSSSSSNVASSSASSSSSSSSSSSFSHVAQVPLSMSNRRQSIALQTKKVEFLESALARLSSEELLLLANRANLLLFARMQQAQQQVAAATGGTHQPQQQGSPYLSPPSGVDHSSAAPTRSATSAHHHPILSPTYRDVR